MEPAWTDITQTIVQVVALLGGLGAAIAWNRSLKDRAAAVLIELEDRFNADSLRKARALLEEQSEYESLVTAMKIALAETTHNELKNSETPAAPTALTSTQGYHLEQLDALLRFYVLLRGIRKAQQVPDESLRLCYGYWLNFYYHNKRSEFSTYVDRYFPGLAKWISDDYDLDQNERFFRPEWSYGKRGIALESAKRSKWVNGIVV